MKKVICTLPNASEEINGVPFKLVDGAAVAEAADDVAKQFDGIPGYEVIDVGPAKAPKKDAAA